MKGDDCLAFSSLHPAFGQKGKAGGLLGRPTDDTQRQRLPTRHAGHGLKPIRTGSTVGHIIANKPIEKTGLPDIGNPFNSNFTWHCHAEKCSPFDERNLGFHFRFYMRYLTLGRSLGGVVIARVIPRPLPA